MSLLSSLPALSGAWVSCHSGRRLGLQGGHVRSSVGAWRGPGLLILLLEVLFPLSTYRPACCNTVNCCFTTGFLEPVSSCFSLASFHSSCVLLHHPHHFCGNEAVQEGDGILSASSSVTRAQATSPGSPGHILACSYASLVLLFLCSSGRITDATVHGSPFPFFPHLKGLLHAGEGRCLPAIMLRHLSSPISVIGCSWLPRMRSPVSCR